MTIATTTVVVFAFLLLGSISICNAFDYVPNLDSASQNLVDNTTQIDELRTIFIDDVTLVYIEGMEWSPVSVEDVEDDGNTTNIMKWETSVNGEIQATGEIDLSDVNRELPTSFEAGSIQVKQKQTSTVTVTVYLDTTTSSNSNNYQTYRRGICIIPLLFILLFALATRMVVISMFIGIFIGSCIITGSINEGFKITLSEFLVGAAADEGHVYVVLFTFFLSGAVGMMQKSGGMLGFTRDISKVATTPRLGQAACMMVGILIFFDDYANILLAGETMRPLLDVLSVSREKLSFIVDATSAPIASISPISSWVGFEVGLIQEAIDIIVKRNDPETIGGGGGGDVLQIPESGFAVFLNSLRYAYYSWFMLVFIALIIFFQRDSGPMLLAERKVRIYDRTDGGPGKGTSSKKEGEDDENQPVKDQPLYSYNLLLPVGILVALIFALLVETGTSGSGEEQSFMDKIESSDSYSALLWGTMATAWLTLILYLLQITIPGTGTLCWPTPERIWDMMPWRKSIVEERGELQPRFLMSVSESVESFLYGMGRVFLAIVILTLAWASGSLMVTIGVDRLFASVIVSGAIPYQMLPTITFIMAWLMGTAMGSSWGVMAILFPLVLVPTYTASDGNPEIFYATTSAILGGAVAGDHMSPISDTTVLSALACDVTLMQHVITQAPYAMWVVLISLLFGYIPIGYDAYPSFVGIILGIGASVLFVFVICVPIISPTGRWDPITKLLCGHRELLQTLSDDCIKKSNGQTLIGEDSDSPEDDNDNDEIKKGEVKDADVDVNKGVEEAVVDVNIDADNIKENTGSEEEEIPIN